MNLTAIENAFLTETPEECVKLYRNFINDSGYDPALNFTGRVLGFVCRFRGMEWVKALTESGASFVSGDREYGWCYCWLAVLNMNKTVRSAHCISRTDPLYDESYKFTLDDEDEEMEINVLPIEQRKEIAAYMYENRDRLKINASLFLYYSIISGSDEIIRTLKEHGAKLSETHIKGLTEDGRSLISQEFRNFTYTMTNEEFSAAASRLSEEMCGKKLYYRESLHSGYLNSSRLFQPDFFKTMLEYFDQKKMNKTRIMKGAIDADSVECIEECIKYGWLNQPKKRDEIIDYAAETKKTECAAFLLDYKNRTADLSSEKAKAEQKIERELNENPNSLTALKKNWGFEKKKDGTLKITSYKGKSTVINVPKEIGGAAVTEIGEWAFSPHAYRIKQPTRDLRGKITKVILPEGLKKIGRSAFRDLTLLESVNIPDTVKSIGERAFSDCYSLKVIIVPEGVTRIDDNAFSMKSGFGKLEYVQLPKTLSYFKKDCKRVRVYLFNDVTCPKLVVGVPHAPNVEEFCEFNKVNFKYTEGK